MTIDYEPIIDDVRKALDHQIAKWGRQSHTPLMWTVINTEEQGEVGRAAFEWAWATTASDRQLHLMEFICENLQVAAVAIAAVESIQRQMAEGTLTPDADEVVQ